MSQPTPRVETRTELIVLGVDGIVRCRVKRTTEHNLEDAIENVRATASLTAGVRAPLLLDAREAATISREAREYYTGVENRAVVLATAMLIASSVGRIIGNFLIKVNQPTFPFRLFSDEDAALAWLTEVQAKHRSDEADGA